MKLTYKTRGGASPQGKPRVYFCAHAQEQALFLDEICADLFKTQNCAVWYKENPQDVFTADEMQMDLGQMQLFVLPVTTRFLLQSGTHMQEFAFAVQNKIPVLPLMQESGLVSVFNEKCGEIQFLDKTAQDETAISYAEKLEKYLASVLIGDELAEKIRAAFDAYIFLSYRKKDRAYAQELMRLIHKNEFCRDIAIWYDEFLTPGENFNKAIEDALKKSDLFALVVTPHLVDEENYVMTTEYPMALREGKKVLSAELLPTDRYALNEKFKGLDAPTNAHDERALSSALLTAVQALAIKENDTSPEHNFFIGLAYLSGIDVEVDKERALSLIENSAKAGLPEAIEKLVQMYRNGEGVERDYGRSVFWQEKLAALRERAFCETNRFSPKQFMDWDFSVFDEYRAWQKEYANPYLEALFALATLYDEQRKRELAAQTFEKLIDCANALMDVGFQRMASLLTSKNLFCFVSAQLWFGEKKRCLELSEIIDFDSYANCDGKEAQIAAVFYEKLGDMYNGDEAFPLYDSAAQARLSLIKATDDVQHRFALCRLYRKMGDCKTLERESYYIKALDEAETINEGTQTFASLRNLADGYLAFTKLPSFGNDETFAVEEYCRLALGVAQDLAEESDLYSDWKRVIDCYCTLCKIYETRRGIIRWDWVEDFYNQALQIVENLLQTYAERELLRKKVELYLGLADICRRTGNTKKGRTYIYVARPLAKRNARDSRTHADEQILERANELLAVFCGVEDEYKRKRQIKNWQKRKRKAPQNPWYFNGEYVAEALDEETDLENRLRAEVAIEEMRALRRPFFEKQGRGESMDEIALWSEIIQKSEQCAEKSGVHYALGMLAENYMYMSEWQAEDEERQYYVCKAIALWDTLDTDYPEGDYYGKWDLAVGELFSCLENVDRKQVSLEQIRATVKQIIEKKEK